MNNLIELQDVNLIRNGKALLKEINWQVKENECFRPQWSRKIDPPQTVDV